LELMDERVFTPRERVIGHSIECSASAQHASWAIR
jgi:hypothetical protein